MTAKGELATLRYSLRRVAQTANRRGANLNIPEPGNVRGWNWLCADLITWLELEKVPTELPVEPSEPTE